MTVQELIHKLQQLRLPCDTEIWIEQTNDNGAEKSTAIELFWKNDEPRITIIGDKFK